MTADRVEELRTRRVAAAMAKEQARTSVDAASAALTEARVRKQAALAALDSTKAQHVASTAALAQARGDRARAEDTLGQVGNVNARVAVAEAAVHAAALDLAYCRVTAPFSGRVVNLTSPWAPLRGRGGRLHARGHRHVVRGGELPGDAAPPHPGAPADIHLQSQPGRRFRGTGGRPRVGHPSRERHERDGLPKVEKSIDWVRLAARFPLRIKVEDPDESFRLGASAVVTIDAGAARPPAGR